MLYFFLDSGGELILSTKTDGKESEFVLFKFSKVAV